MSVLHHSTCVYTGRDWTECYQISERFSQQTFHLVALLEKASLLQVPSGALPCINGGHTLVNYDSNMTHINFRNINMSWKWHARAYNGGLRNYHNKNIHCRSESYLFLLLCDVVVVLQTRLQKADLSLSPPCKLHYFWTLCIFLEVVHSLREV